MLRRFLYLDTEALHQYASAIEGGERTGTTRKTTASRDRGVAADAKVLKGNLKHGSADEEAHSLGDTDAARFDRLLSAANQNAEALGWVDVSQPDVDLEGIGTGAMVALECELYVPDAVKMTSQASGMLPMLKMLQDISPAAKSLGPGRVRDAQR
jgi:hypothetical protein